MFGMTPELMLAIVGITLFAGLVKGVVGFAMPMIMISGLASVLPAEQALSALILPTLVTNLVQGLRQGWRAAWASVRAFWRLIVVTCLFILLSAQLVTVTPQAVLLAGLGLPIVAYAVAQLAGADLRFRTENRGRAEVLTGVVGGFYGGMSGVWGPPTIALLVSLGVDKRESVRVQGVVYLIGSVMLMLAHFGSGVLNGATLPLSAALVLPSLAGLLAGFALHDRLDAARFRRWTLVVLALTGLNLVRRALTL